MENKNLKTEQAKDNIVLSDVMRSALLDAFKGGYEKRICEQLQKALDGEGQSSTYNQSELDASAEKWVSRHFS